MEQERRNSLIQLMRDTALGTPQGKFANIADANAKITEEVNKILGIEKPGQRIKTFAFKQKQDEVFSIIIEALELATPESFKDMEILNWVDYRNLADGDTNEFYMDDPSLFKVAMISNGNRDMRAFRMADGKVTVGTNRYGIKIYEELDRILTGRLDWAKLVNKVTDSINVFIAEQASTGLFSYIQNIAAPLGISKSWNEQSFFDVADRLEAATRREVQVFGTKQALRKVQDAQVDQTRLNEKNEVGYYGNKGGYSLIKLNNYLKGMDINDDYALPTNRLIFVPNGTSKMIKFVYEGDFMIEDVSDKNTRLDERQEYDVTFRFGIAVLPTYQYIGTYEIL